jgi:hypothetical protein
MVCNTPSYGHAPTYQISLTYLERNNYLILRSKVKVQTKVIMVHDTPPYGHAPIPNIIDLSQKKPLLELEVKVQQRSLWYATHRLMDMHPYQISLTYLKRNNYLTLRSKSNKGHYGMQHTTLWTCTHIPNIIDLSRKKQLFDLEVKVQQRSLWYATHHLMDMHPYTKYH